ncbi:phage head morphogenesis protein [Clostridium botulinum]|nr:phage head morphogenesis protein [Clostridium botulinum]NFD35118.1 phage head morphogenesis protein [Clostridium botulinum]NFD59958.1 phage head morphogenesis protein [Clostridium botulinum]NFE02257.1 phage head morphogenesis protein [Clostridium botulinum]
MNYSKNEEEEFIQSLYDEAGKRFKEIYREQQRNRNELLRELSLILLTYTILNEFMSMKKSDREKESNKFYALITGFARNQIKLTTAALYEVTNNVVKNTYKFYSYNVNARDIKKIVDSAYEGKHFSKRVWNNEKKVAEHLHKQVKNFLDGKVNVNQIKKDIEKTFNSNAYEARRLVEAEVNRCEDEAFKKFCKETGVKKVRRNEVLDRRTCSECADLDGKIYDLNDAPGTVHPLCRGFNTIEE